MGTIGYRKEIGGIALHIMRFVDHKTLKWRKDRILIIFNLINHARPSIGKQ